MTSLLTGSVAFAGFVIAAETYRSYKEKVETHNIRNWIFLKGFKFKRRKINDFSQEEQTAQAELEVKAEVNSAEKMICHILTQFVSSRQSESNNV